MMYIICLRLQKEISTIVGNITFYMCEHYENGSEKELEFEISKTMFYLGKVSFHFKFEQNILK